MTPDKFTGGTVLSTINQGWGSGAVLALGLTGDVLKPKVLNKKKRLKIFYNIHSIDF